MDKNTDGMSEQAHRNRTTIESIRGRMLRGEITHTEAKAEAKPIIDAMNARAKELAKEYGVRFKPMTFEALMR